MNGERRYGTQEATVTVGTNGVLSFGDSSHGPQSYYVPTSIGACSKIYTTTAVIEHVSMEVGT